MIKQEFCDGKIVVYNTDCQELMKTLSDNSIDLVLTDPPYGIGGDSLHSNRKLKSGGKFKNRALNTMDTSWDIAPAQEVFDEIFRISNNQIIWGGNYFNLPKTRGIICWDKCQPFPNFSAWEMGWTSFNSVARIYKFDNRTGNKIHPTQKPTQLISWCLENYSKENDLIFDGFLGSGTTAISCIKGNRRFIGCELDNKYFDLACERIEYETRQGRLF
jgi:site-specific DNA-methyltransferase (adenine-specific)